VKINPQPAGAIHAAIEHLFQDAEFVSNICGRGEQRLAGQDGRKDLNQTDLPSNFCHPCRNQSLCNTTMHQSKQLRTPAIIQEAINRLIDC
jgi:hypothetical protein